jgi:hypothetical protein
MNETPPNFGGVLLFGAAIGEAGGRPVTHYGLRMDAGALRGQGFRLACAFAEEGRKLIQTDLVRSVFYLPYP